MLAFRFRFSTKISHYKTQSLSLENKKSTIFNKVHIQNSAFLVVRHTKTYNVCLLHILAQILIFFSFSTFLFMFIKQSFLFYMPIPLISPCPPLTPLKFPPLYPHSLLREGEATHGELTVCHIT